MEYAQMCLTFNKQSVTLVNNFFGHALCDIQAVENAACLLAIHYFSF